MKNLFFAFALFSSFALRAFAGEPPQPLERDRSSTGITIEEIREIRPLANQLDLFVLVPNASALVNKNHIYLKYSGEGVEAFVYKINSGHDGINEFTVKKAEYNPATATYSIVIATKANVYCEENTDLPTCSAGTEYGIELKTAPEVSATIAERWNRPEPPKKQ